MTETQYLLALAAFTSGQYAICWIPGPGRIQRRLAVALTVACTSYLTVLLLIAAICWAVPVQFQS